MSTDKYNHIFDFTCLCFFSALNRNNYENFIFSIVFMRKKAYNNKS